ncbi:hypothetical protein HII31_02557 [Pseudocercospora fuligena]|uniref:Uncharacterized protein n=1 Tax=Pseudocercospora fuligena TaxID=685502 RepID=A0A8H6RPM3_9PEZI|nr:hypothetical protein HII31_02557 [Pseudocercospora fuligena]
MKPTIRTTGALPAFNATEAVTTFCAAAITVEREITQGVGRRRAGFAVGGVAEKDAYLLFRCRLTWTNGRTREIVVDNFQICGHKDSRESGLRPFQTSDVLATNSRVAQSGRTWNNSFACSSQLHRATRW